MEAKVKATGEVGVVAGINLLFGNKGYRYQSDEVEIINSDTDVDITKDVDYWEKLKHQTAISAMQGMMSNEYTHKLYLDNKNYPNGLLNDSIKIATALVEKLKENKV